MELAVRKALAKAVTMQPKALKATVATIDNGEQTSLSYGIILPSARMGNKEREDSKGMFQDISMKDKGNIGAALCSVSTGNNNGGWLLDSKATDHMTFIVMDFSNFSHPWRKSIANANVVLSPVTGADTVTISPTLKLSNTLLVPSLSHRLLSFSQITKKLNCVVLMYPKFCLPQDTLPKEIIGCCTKREGLYYMEDFGVCHVHLTHGSAEQQILLWHRWLGHPSLK